MSDIGSSGTSSTKIQGEIVDWDQLVEDTRYLVDKLEAIHPDPYLNMGGKIKFHRRFYETLLSIPGAGMTSIEYATLLMTFLASMEDTHCFIQEDFFLKGGFWKHPGGIPLYFNVVETDLYVQKVPVEAYRDLIGCRLVSVEGVPYRELVDRQRKLCGSKNSNYLLVQLGTYSTLIRGYLLEYLVPEWKDKSRVRVELYHPDGGTGEHIFPTSWRLEFLDEITPRLFTAGTNVELPPLVDSDFAYGFLDDERKTAVLVVDGMLRFREFFEEMQTNNSVNLRDGIEKFYRKYKMTGPPGSIEESLKGIPSATETFRSLVVDMKKAQTKCLIIDLSRNSGGHSAMADILIYLLYGKEKLREGKLGIDIVRRYSSHHLRNNPDVKLPIFHGIPLRPDDYDFSQDTSPFPGQEGSVSPPSFSKMPTFTREYASGEYEKYYLPERVICICSANTFSSGYTFTRYLYNAGATLVGTASAQEGNTGGVITDITLPNTGIKVAIPQTIGVVYLDRPDLGTMLHPHHELTYDKLVSYNFDENAGILYALEISKNQKNAKPKGV